MVRNCAELFRVDTRKPLSDVHLNGAFYARLPPVCEERDFKNTVSRNWRKHAKHFEAPLTCTPFLNMCKDYYINTLSNFCTEVQYSGTACIDNV